MERLLLSVDLHKVQDLPSDGNGARSNAKRFSIILESRAGRSPNSALSLDHVDRNNGLSRYVCCNWADDLCQVVKVHEPQREAT